MKSTILLSAALVVVCFVTETSAQSSSPHGVWGNAFYGVSSSGNQSQGNCISADGNVYWHLVGSSRHDSRDVYYNGEVLFQGDDYDPSGTSQNNNLCVIKTDRAGNVIWKLNSLTCDWAPNSGNIAPTSDGGVVFSSKLRSTDSGDGGNSLFKDVMLIDGKGITHSFPWKYNESDTRRFYQFMVGRIAADGELKWVKFFQHDRTPAPMASGNYADYQAEAIQSRALAVDDSDNIYFGGNYRNRMEIPVSSGSVVLTPHNVGTWNGDPQSVVGDLFIIKLDGSDGEYLAHVVTDVIDGRVQSENIDCLVWADGSLYAQGLVYGNGSRISVGNEEISFEGDFSPLLLAMDTSLKPKWTTPLKGEQIGGKYGFQNCSIAKCGSTLWFTGQYNGKVSYSPDICFSSIPSPTGIREGFLAKFDPDDGSMIKGVTSTDAYPRSLGTLYSSICGYLQAIQNPEHPENVYVYGYGMNQNLGVFIRTYNAETLESDPAGEWKMVTGGNMPTGQSVAYDPESAMIFTTTRGRTSPFVLIGGVEVEAAPANTWSVLMAGFDMPDIFRQSGIVNNVISESSLVIRRMEDQLVIFNSGDSVHVNIFDIAGRCVASVEAREGRTAVSLAHGVYIVNGHKIVI